MDYTKEDVSQAALMSRHAPYAVVLDCVGGKDVVQHMDNLVLHDPKAPHLGIYVTIVGDSEWIYDESDSSAPCFFNVLCFLLLNVRRIGPLTFFRPCLGSVSPPRCLCAAYRHAFHRRCCYALTHRNWT